jgi:hypothetical protein
LVKLIPCRAFSGFLGTLKVSNAKYLFRSILKLHEGGDAMLHLLLAAAILSQAIQQPTADQHKPPAPIRVSSKEAAQHSIHDGDNWLYLRIPQNQWSFFSAIKVTAVVDTTGAVISSVPQRERERPDGNRRISTTVLAQADAMVRALRFKPFERGGHPVSVTFDWDVALLPPELKPEKRVPFPKVKDWKAVRITLARTGCFGTCSSYSVEVRGDGSVSFDGHGFVAFTGAHRGLVPQSNVIELVKLFEKADFYSLRNEYTASVTDNPSQTISIEIDGRQKQVVDYVGLSAGMPLPVSELEAAIDRLSGSERWTHGTSETMAALEAEHWNFKSPEAAATLVRAAEYGNADVVRGLALAGVPLYGGKGNNRNTWNRANSSLETAAFRGDVLMLRALFDAGAGTGAKSLAAALVAAAGSGNVAALRLVLENGAGITSRDAEGRTVLIAAATSGYPEMIREVLKNHADVNAAAAPPLPPCTAEKKNDNCWEFTPGDGQTALMGAVSRSDYDVSPEGLDRVEVVRLLIAAGADVNARDKAGNTALILGSDNREQVRLLIEAGADVNARNLEGETALSKTYHDDVKEILIKHGAMPIAEKVEEKQN